MLLLFRQLFKSISRKKQLNSILLIFTMAVSSLTEILSVALFLPFISVVLGNTDVIDGKLFLFINRYLDNKNLILLIIFIFITSALIRVSTLIWQNKFAANASNEITYKAYNALLSEEYNIHIKKSKSDLISIIHTHGFGILRDTISPLLILIESIIFLLIVFIALFIYNWKIVLSIIFSLYFIYQFLFKRANKTLKRISLKEVQLNEKLLERLDVEINSIEYIHLGNYQNTSSKNYAEYDREYKINFTNYLITARLPRILIEYLLLIIILVLIMFLYLTNNISNTLPLLASGALLIQKTIPYVQKIFENWSSLAHYKYPALSVLEYASKYKKYANEKDKEYEYLDFQEMKLIAVDYYYDNKNKILNDLSFSINKGDKIAIMGPSGSGKTTLLRLMCGLLIPTSGKVLINGIEINKGINYSHTINWMRSIGYVPQKINLTGRTLRENIIFNTKLDPKNSLKIEDVIKITLLEDLVDRCNGLDSNIFQNSFSLSGGENQRLAIARAIYRNPKLLIMDEPTSSLDIETQKKLFDNLLKLKDMTCIVITHRLETKYFFDNILKMNSKNS